MHFHCPRCGRRHEFPAARMNAAGRVPCKCEATLILEPTRLSRPLSSPDLENADIVRLGYRIRAQNPPRPFEMLRRAIHEHMTRTGPDERARPAGRQAGPFLLAAGVAWDPRLFGMPAVVALAVLSLRWPLGWLAGAAPAVEPLFVAVQSIAGGLLLALAAPSVAASLAASAGDEARPSSTWCALGSLIRGSRRHLGHSVLRHALAPILLVGALLMASATLDQLAAYGRMPWLLRLAVGPVGLGLTLGAVLCGLAVLLATLTHSALAPRAAEMLPVQFELGVRRIRGRDRLLPGPTLAIATAASLFGLLVLASAVALMFALRSSRASASYAEAATGMAIARDLLLALGAGVWTAFVGVAGMLCERPASAVVARPPARAPEIITGTQKSMQAVMESPLEASDGGDEGGGGPAGDGTGEPPPS